MAKAVADHLGDNRRCPRFQSEAKFENRKLDQRCFRSSARFMAASDTTAGHFPAFDTALCKGLKNSAKRPTKEHSPRTLRSPAFAVFIRAPAILRTGDGVRELARAPCMPMETLHSLCDNVCIHRHVQVYTHTYAHRENGTDTCTHARAHIYACMHAYIRTYVHTRTHRRFV